MNTSHYPSLELCKKLTEIGFPETEKSWGHTIWNDKGKVIEANEILDREICDIASEVANYDSDQTYPRTIEYYYPSTFMYVCPSVMEMMDVIPENLFLKEKKTDEFYPYYPLYITYSDSGKKVEYRSIVYSYRDSVKMDCMLQNHCLVKFEDKLPNALAEMVLWLHGNKYIKF